ncbi:glycosyltransferase [Georgenia sp. SUBG003]|uniref:glycosyltransferase n=1 Tax=Georgenia sp. SUBG003 TaxID=1497974 RepID=UPI003AB45B8E
MAPMSTESPVTDAWLVIPLYNEAAVIGDVVTGARKRFPNVVCVDDGSADASAAVAERAGAWSHQPHPCTHGGSSVLPVWVAPSRVSLVGRGSSPPWGERVAHVWSQGLSCGCRGGCPLRPGGRLGVRLPEGRPLFSEAPQIRLPEGATALVRASPRPGRRRL